MTRLGKGLLLHSLLFGVCPTVVLAQATEIRIESSWSGLGEPQSKTLVIRGKNDKYRSGLRHIDPRLVQEFFRTLEQPSVEKPVLANLGIDKGWLITNVASAVQTYTKRLKRPYQSQVDLFTKKFTDPDFAQLAIDRAFSFVGLDDEPRVEVTIKVGSRTLSLVSYSQHEFMIPWTIREGVHSRITFNADVSRALVKLLPRRFVNKDRLEGAHLIWELTDQVMWLIRDEWGILEIEERFPEKLAEVRKQYKVFKSQVNCRLSIDVHKCESWNAELTRDGLPSNVSLGISLPVEEGRLIGFEEFQGKMENVISLVLSVIWLKEQLRADATLRVEIRFVAGFSASSYVRDKVVSDMNEHGKGHISSRIMADWEETAFIQFEGPSGYSRWFVFPNREMLLWHFRGDCNLPFDEQSLSSWDYYGHKAVGVLVDPNGRVVGPQP